MLAALFRTLSKPGAMEILTLADRGISKSTDAMNELGLSPKRYYSRLRELVDMGLMVGRDGAYRLTALGRIIHGRVLPILDRACVSRGQLMLLDELEAANVDDEVRGAILRALEESGVLGFMESEGGLRPVRVIDDYEALVGELVNQCDIAKESILLASNYMEIRVVEAVLRAMKRGVAFRLIVGKEGLSRNILRLRALLSPRFAKALIEIMGSPNDLGNMIREAELTNSFCIIDGARSIFELPKPVRKGFWIAFIVEGQVINGSLTDGFRELWKTGKPNVMLRFIRSLKGKASNEDDDLEDEVEGQDAPEENFAEVGDITPAL